MVKLGILTMARCYLLQMKFLFGKASLELLNTISRRSTGQLDVPRN